MSPRDNQDYVFLYCKYDAKSEIRNYLKLLNTPAMREIDIDNAMKALAEDERKEVEKIIYYGSPQVQQLKEAERNIYVAEILDEAERRLLDS